ncbi:MAG: DNA methyltransferase [Saccharofermentanales bacterium]|jgi:site-specific DNA-methyltransferase (adenine-specific)
MIDYRNEDCMAGMARYPDKYFDLAIVDPPYGTGSVTYMPRTRDNAFGGYIDKYEITVATLDANQRALSKVEVVHTQTSKETIRNFSEANASPNPLYFEELFRISKNQIIWGGNYFILPPSRGFVVWHKTTVAETFSMAMCEYAWVSFNTNSKMFSGAPQGTAKDPRVHPTQKPVALYKWLLKNYAKKGDLILDTHVGSASSLIACHDMGFDAVGFELDEDYYKASKQRLERHMRQISMFDLTEESK